MLSIAGYKISVSVFPCFHNDFIKNCVIGVRNGLLSGSCIQKDAPFN